MALEKCPFCDAEVSVSAEKCPKCGKEFTYLECPDCHEKIEKHRNLEPCPKCGASWKTFVKKRINLIPFKSKEDIENEIEAKKKDIKTNCVWGIVSLFIIWGLFIALFIGGIDLWNYDVRIHDDTSEDILTTFIGFLGVILSSIGIVFFWKRFKNPVVKIKPDIQKCKHCGEKCEFIKSEECVRTEPLERLEHITRDGRECPQYYVHGTRYYYVQHSKCTKCGYDEKKEYTRDDWDY